MGAWGITAFESDDGLDAASLIRAHITGDGVLEAAKVITAMQQGEWYTPDVTIGQSHTGPMTLAEIMVRFINRDVAGLDNDGEWAQDEGKFQSLPSFTADKDSVQWLRDYLSGTLGHARENAEIRARRGSYEWDQHGGWREKASWHG